MNEVRVNDDLGLEVTTVRGISGNAVELELAVAVVEHLKLDPVIFRDPYDPAWVGVEAHVRKFRLKE